VSTSLNSGSTSAQCDGGQPLGDLAAIDDGGIIAVDTMLDGVAESVILHRDGDSARAWFNVCPHAGRRLDWEPGRFLVTKDGLLVCAVHGATFELVAGDCVAGPCRGDRLRAVAVEVRDGRVWLSRAGEAGDASRTTG
jgi:nitrite reductase/ring-hydroxylating ferredoxin subunit